jgi:hypothetical protein
MLPEVTRSPEELNEALENRFEMLAGDLVTMSRITQRGAVMTPERRARVSAIRQYALRVLDALEKGEPAAHPSDHKEKADFRRWRGSFEPFTAPEWEEPDA